MLRYFNYLKSILYNICYNEEFIILIGCHEHLQEAVFKAVVYKALLVYGKDGILVYKIFIVNVVYAYMYLSATWQFWPFQRSWTGISWGGAMDWAAVTGGGASPTGR